MSVRASTIVASQRLGTPLRGKVELTGRTQKVGTSTFRLPPLRSMHDLDKNNVNYEFISKTEFFFRECRQHRGVFKMALTLE